MGRGVQPVDSISTAKWDGPKLTIVTKQEMGGRGGSREVGRVAIRRLSARQTHATCPT